MAFSLLAVGVVKGFLLTSCFIPYSGMENTLYRGEGILVEKWSYGPRMPWMGLFGYHRLGSGRVATGDILLFNAPAGAQKGDADFQAVFIGRCVGAPGDTLLLDAQLEEVTGRNRNPDVKSLYAYPAEKEDLVIHLMDRVGISGNKLLTYTPGGEYVRSFSRYEYYLLSQKAGAHLTFTPLDSLRTDAGYPVVVPARGIPVEVRPWNAGLLGQAIRAHEHRRAEVRNGTLLVDGRKVKHYTFTQNYLWVTLNDPVNQSDSRMFGFLPETLVIGRAWRIWFPSQSSRFFQRIQ